MPKFLTEYGYNIYSSGKLHYLPYTPSGTANTHNGFEKTDLAESGRMLSAFDTKKSIARDRKLYGLIRRCQLARHSRAHGVGINDIHSGTSPLPEKFHSPNEPPRHFDQIHDPRKIQ